MDKDRFSVLMAAITPDIIGKIMGKYSLDEEAIEKYEMRPFDRTLIDKVFATCDYAVSNNTTGYSRHIYDLYRLLDIVVLDEKLKLLVTEVREDRKNTDVVIPCKTNTTFQAF